MDVVLIPRRNDQKRPRDSSAYVTSTESYQFCLCRTRRLSAATCRAPPRLDSEPICTRAGTLGRPPAPSNVGAVRASSSSIGPMRAPRARRHRRRPRGYSRRGRAHPSAKPDRRSPADGRPARTPHRRTENRPPALARLDEVATGEAVCGDAQSVGHARHLPGSQHPRETRDAVRMRIPTRAIPDPACRSLTSVTGRARRRSDRRPNRTRMRASHSASPRLRLTRCTGSSPSITHVATTTRAGADAASSRG